MNKKKIPKKVDIQHNDGLCLHIQTLFANFEILENFFLITLHPMFIHVNM